MTRAVAHKRERVRDYLLELVETRPPGTSIPSERTLCALLSVSRPTLRAAVDELVHNGLLVREHGRGMFVAAAKITQELVGVDTALGAPRADGDWRSRVLGLTRTPAGARVGRKLGVSPAAEVTWVTRLRLVDGVPIAVEHLHIPVAVAADLSTVDFEGAGLYAALRARGVVAHEATQSIEPTVTDETESGLLGVPLLTPALLFERRTTDAEGRVVEYARSIYRGDRYRIVSRLSLA
ncbi:MULTISPECIES: GntR family transcriptional regulator [unclassified Crossiella]|uniref:GntR family transcriptional regulator n=1 Tax=unclassified Crossiella TaxID=2620835 RepID=UPI001FFEAFCF|nr:MULTISPECIES: GntR family transcriptional regulator [unclassified Crossiella]MCK2239593.1 GntR family transcriptional regulator [Crossiella sp. S99.2]MCK2252288.1 GntR family transcriptional regulator [Crossiella sp. S99.1]